MNKLITLLIVLLTVSACSGSTDETPEAPIDVLTAIDTGTAEGLKEKSSPTPIPSIIPTPILISTPIAKKSHTLDSNNLVKKTPGNNQQKIGKPKDNYSCNINSDGYCIFSGNPHKTGLEPGTKNIVDLEGNFLFYLNESISINSLNQHLNAKGTPAAEGDELIKYSEMILTNDEKSFHKVMAIMFPIRNALMYDISEMTQYRWDQLVNELEKRKIKDSSFLEGSTPKDNYYGRQGIFELAKNPNGRDIHHDVMKFLEESGLYLLCHVTSNEFNQMLQDTHPENHNPCQDAKIVSKIPFEIVTFAP